MLTVRIILDHKGSEVHTIARDSTVLDAARRMNEHRIGALCVMDGETLVGMFTERDVLNRIVAKQLDPAATAIADVMSAPVVTCGPESTIAQCAATMSGKKIRHLPVVEGESAQSRLVGLVSTGDLMAIDVAQKQQQIDHLHDYLHGRS